MGIPTGKEDTLVSSDSRDPIGVVDRQLWRDAQDMLHRHVPVAGTDVCAWCHRAWPCVAHRVGQRAEVAAFKPWNQAWTARGDLHSIRPSGARPAATATDRPVGYRNRGTFESV